MWFEYTEIHSEYCSSTINGITIKQFSVLLMDLCSGMYCLSITGKILYLPSLLKLSYRLNQEL